MGVVSKAERRYTEGGIAQDLRADGRGRLHFRSFSVEAGVIPQANGSALVRLGGTHVIASVKAELGSPTAGRPSHGQMHVSVDCSPQVGVDADELSLDLSRALHRCLLGGANGAGAAIDLASLALLEGKLCWLLYVDALVLSFDGNLLDCISMAVKAALADTGLPKVAITGAEVGGQVEVDVDDDPEGFARLDSSRVPLIVTLTRVGKDYMVDATEEEEQLQKINAGVSVAVNAQGGITGVVKRTGAGLHPSVLLDMVCLARQVGQKLIQQVEDVTAAAQS